MVALALGLWFVSTSIGSGMLATPLTRGFRPLETAAQAQGAGAIVVLGGGVFEFTAGPDALTYPSDSTAMRTLEGARVFRLLDGHAPIVASGGKPRDRQHKSEARVIAEGLVQLGVPADHVVLEENSGSTHDQAVIVTRLLAARGIRRFVVVTSPSHMSRSVRAFRAQHADVVPSISRAASENLPAERLLVPNQKSFWISNEAIYEYAGTAYYWSRGWFQPAAAEHAK
jgi:uncharacterized SAM-binding protein YcdF (DUF218 family)